MPERIVPGPVSNLRDNCEAVCIHTKKIYDSCRDKDIALLKFPQPHTFHRKKNPPGRHRPGGFPLYLHGFSDFHP